MVGNNDKMKELLAQKTEQLRASEERFRNIVAISTDGIIIVDTLGAIRFVNPAAERLFDRPAKDILGEQFGFPVVANDTTELDIFRSRALNTIVEMRVVATEWDGRDAFLATLRDITERRRAEKELRESEALHRAIFDQAFQLMGLMKPDGTLIKINRKASDFLDIGETEVIGKPFWETPWWTHSPEQQEKLRAAVKMAAGGDFVRFEATHLTPQGKLIWVDFSLKPVVDELGKVILLVPEGRDITERKRKEAQIERLNADLAARAAELEEANKELDAFNYAIAHDLRKPLTIINSYCQVIDQLCGEQLDKGCLGYLKETYKGSVQMNELIDALLNFSKISHLDPHLEMVDLSALAAEITSELQTMEPERRIVCRIAQGVQAEGDPGLLRVVLENLLGNASKYSREQLEAVIEFGIMHIDGKPAFFVRDNGAGFDMAYAEKLFLPFQRLPGAEDYTGHGIGLSTVERIIKRHGGRLWAEAEKGNGAIFYFTLPPGMERNR